MKKIQHVPSADCVLLSTNEVNATDVIPKEVFDFFLLECPYAKSDKSSANSVRSLNLADYGWEKTGLHHILQWVCLHFIDSNGELQLAFKASDNVNETVRALGLDDESPCLSHPRAVLQINNKVSVSEDGKCGMRLKEAYATCLFRHIRNAFAHGNFRADSEGRVLLLDCSSKSGTEIKNRKYTFGMVAPILFLQSLMRVVKNKPEKLLDDSSLRILEDVNYRVKLEEGIALEASEGDFS